jgi:hypothetical protein
VLDAKSTSTGTVTVATTNEGRPPSPPRYWRLIITVQQADETY